VDAVRKMLRREAEAILWGRKAIITGLRMGFEWVGMGLEWVIFFCTILYFLSVRRFLMGDLFSAWKGSG
jgi:hypothetical protein